MFKIFLVVFFLLFSFACSKKSKEPPSESGGVYLQWLLKLSKGQVASVSLTKVDSSLNITPHTVGDYVVVASAKGKSLSAFPFKFPTEMHEEGYDEEGNPFSQTTLLSGEVMAAVWIKVEEPFDKLTVINPQGETILEEKVDAKPAKKEKPAASCQLTPDARTTLPGNIQVLGPGEIGVLCPNQQARVEELVAPTESLLAKVRREIEMAAPATRSGISHFGFARLVPGGPMMYGNACGSVMIINVDAMERPNFPRTIIHEMAHTYERLLNFSTEEGSVGVHWNPQVRRLAQETLNRLGLSFSQGFRSLWAYIQDSAKEYQLTVDYRGEDWRGLSEEQSANYGFARSYGAKEIGEDIATYVEKIQGSALAGQPLFCQRLQGARSQFPLQLVLPYVKILMLKNAGFITAEKAQECHGNVALQGPRGIHFKKADGSTAISFTNNLKAGYQRSGNLRYFSVLGSGPNTYQTLIQVIPPRRGLPVGLYRLDNIGLYEVQREGYNGVYLSHRDNFKARSSAQGLVLISNVNPSENKAEGAIFFLALRNAGGMTIDYFPISTFRYER